MRPAPRLRPRSNSPAPRRQCGPAARAVLQRTHPFLLIAGFPRTKRIFSAHLRFLMHYSPIPSQPAGPIRHRIRRKTMEPRIKLESAPKGALQAMRGLEAYVRGSGLEDSLIELLKTRVSQINGCAYCIDMHTKDARAQGETEQRLYALSAWRETPFFSERERAALEWAEALTLISETHVPDEIYERVRPHFTDVELVNLTLAIVAINGWNRIAISFRAVPGTYQAKTSTAAQS